MLDQLFSNSCIPCIGFDKQVVQVDDLLDRGGGDVRIPRHEANNLVPIYGHRAVHSRICVKTAPKGRRSHVFWYGTFVEHVVLLPEVTPAGLVD